MADYIQKDAECLQKVIAERLGINLSIGDCISFWSKYSEDYFAAGWLSFRGDSPEDEIVKAYQLCGLDNEIDNMIARLKHMNSEFRKKFLEKLNKEILGR